MASCQGAVGPLWPADLKLYYFLTLVDAHPAPLLVVVHTLCDISHALYGIYPYVHTLDWLVFVFFVIMMGQPIYNKDFGPWFVEYLHPVLANF